MYTNPAKITYDVIISSGKKFCVGHTVGYSLHIPNHFFCAYINAPIFYLQVDLINSDITVYFSDGSTADWCNHFFDAYITQFGISISSDGNCIFVQTWENGLYCFSARTGEKIWRTKSKGAVNELYVNESTICANRQNKKLELISIATGTVLEERKITINEFFAVDHAHFMCRTTAKKWEVINSDTLLTIDDFVSNDSDSVRKWFSVFYG